MFDASNPLLTPGPVLMCTGKIRGPDGIEYGVVTLRTTSATVTGYLTREEVYRWASMLELLAGKISPLAAGSGPPATAPLPGLG